MVKTILVIEDEASLRESILTILKIEGFEVLGASTGRKGVELARAHLPDLIIADIMMPELDGYDVLRELRQQSITATIPFIFLTARSTWDDMRRGMELGADDYIPKPFHSQELIASIRTRFEKQALLESERLRALSHYLVEAQETERARLAHELHDDIGQLLNGVKVTLGMSKHLPSHALGSIVAEAEHVIDAIIARLKQLSRDLRPALLDTLGLLPALHQFLEQHPLHAQGKLTFSHQGLEHRFPPEVETTVYRIVQKTFNEITRSAPDTEVQLSIWTDPNALCVEILDCNSSSDLKTTVHLNPATTLTEIVERVTLLGGQFLIESTPEHHTRIFAQLPIVLPVAQDVPGDDARATEGATRVVLADSRDWIRQGLRTLFESEPGVHIVSERASLDAVAATCAHERPDVLIIDPTMPEGSPFDLIATIKEAAPDTRILVLSTQVEAIFIAEIFRSGATGYAFKESRADDLRQALRAVAAGDRYISATLAIDSIEAYLQPGERAPDQDPHDILTERELEILQLIVEGYKSTEIADMLSISPRTVETHRANMKRKLDVRTQANLIRFAIEHNLITDT